MADVKKKLQRDYLTALKGNYVLWPAAQLINFAFVPPPLAVLYVSGVALVWNTWLCWLNAQQTPVENAPLQQQ